MNRLIIVGNGFDLAHGLPTGYCDFIHSYWSNILNNMKFPYLPNTEVPYEDNMINIKLQFYVDFYDMETIGNELRLVKTFKELEKFIYKYDCSISFKNNFFKKINSLNSIHNWVDIENEYYKLLKDCLKEKDDNSKAKKT